MIDPALSQSEATLSAGLSHLRSSSSDVQKIISRSEEAEQTATFCRSVTETLSVDVGELEFHM